ncbi:MAG: hypothetical protein ACI8PT_002125 [Gammaproteobacteria bacterium]|jgi:hypothetical protein
MTKDVADRSADEPTPGQTVETFVQLAHGTDVSPERAHQMSRILNAARSTIGAVTPPTLFDTEPDQLRVLLETSTQREGGKS